MIQESFLHFVWQNQYFNSRSLSTHHKEPIQILKVGYHNQLAGPDFKEAELKINGIRWAGSVEIHFKSSDWYRHKHQGDQKYDNVILHVVYDHDQEVYTSDGNIIPTLKLKGIIKPKVLERYQLITENQDIVPCEKQLQTTKVITRLTMLEKVLVGRLQSKAEAVTNLLKSNNYDWEETAYQWLARGLGFKTNAESMEELTKLLPVKVLHKQSSLHQYEALLFGLSGLLSIDVKDEYLVSLKSEFKYLSNKYDLKRSLTYNQWHFSGVRPSNYPTIRIAQLAALLYEHQNIFSLFTAFESPEDLIDKLQSNQSEYWQSHVVPDKACKLKIRALTKAAKQNLLINTTVPLLVAFSKYKDKPESLGKALNLLMTLPKEENSITRKWSNIGWNVVSAFDSQGLIELYNNFCALKKCASCNIGAELIKA